jgi:hypothetical protein
LSPERLLVVLLRLCGGVIVLAFAAMVMPTAWMVSTHAWLGLGELPRLPIVDYLTRSLAALYGFHGVLLLVISRDPVRYLGIVRYVGVTNILFGAVMIGIGAHAGMPWWWGMAEGPPVAVVGLILLYLAARARR